MKIRAWNTLEIVSKDSLFYSILPQFFLLAILKLLAKQQPKVLSEEDKQIRKQSNAGWDQQKV